MGNLREKAPTYGSDTPICFYTQGFVREEVAGGNTTLNLYEARFCMYAHKLVDEKAFEKVLATGVEMARIAGQPFVDPVLVCIGYEGDLSNTVHCVEHDVAKLLVAEYGYKIIYPKK